MPQAMTERFMAWVELFNNGGPLMYPIFICSVTALAVIFERLWMLRMKRIIVEGVIREAASLLKAGKFDEAKAALEGCDTAMCRIVLEGMLKAGHGREEVREAMEDAARLEGHILSQFINMLGGIAGVTPLLGFLGTVYGMIISFNVIAREGVGNAGEVAGGIAMALITTAAGLTVAIPAYIAYRYFLARVDNIMAELEERSIEFLDLISETSLKKEAQG